MTKEPIAKTLCSRCGAAHEPVLGDITQGDGCAVEVGMEDVAYGLYGSDFDSLSFNILAREQTGPAGSVLCDQCVVRLIDLGALGLTPLNRSERFSILWRNLGFIPGMSKKLMFLTRKLQRAQNGDPVFCRVRRLTSLIIDGDAAGARLLLAVDPDPAATLAKIASEGPHETRIPTDMAPADVALLNDLSTLTGHARMRLVSCPKVPLTEAFAVFERARRAEAEAIWASKERKIPLWG